MAVVEATQFVIVVGGTDCSTRFASRLIIVDVDDNSGETADTCKITLDDTGGVIAMPQKGAKVQVSLGPLEGGVMQVFDGVVDDVRAVLDRGGGRRLEVEAKSSDTSGKQKTQMRKHWDDKSAGDVLKEAGQAAGVSVTVAGRISGIKRKYWAQDHESFLHFAQRLSNELGGTFKTIGGTRAVILDRNEGQTAGGSGIGSVTAQVGRNLISASISPILTRPRFQDVVGRWYDYKKAKWVEEKVQVDKMQGADATADVRNSKQDADEAKETGKSKGKESTRDKGAGTVIIDGNPAARAEGQCTVVGVRPGVDGTYTIDKANHKLERGNGYITTLTLKKPEGASDTRGTGGSGAGGGSGAAGGDSGSYPGLYT